MANVEQQTGGGLIGEALSYAFRHPVKAVGNTVMAAYAVHLAREWGAPIANTIAKHLESRRQPYDEGQSVEQIEQ